MRRIALVLMAATFVGVTAVATGPALAAVAQDPYEEKKEAEQVVQEKGPEAPVAKEELKEAAKGIGDPTEEKIEAQKAPPGKEKEEKQEAKKAALPKTAGITPGNAAFLALGASALLVAGGLLVRRLVR
jgi:outer membrane biosynthesis protein TonB